MYSRKRTGGLHHKIFWAKGGAGRVKVMSPILDEIADEYQDVRPLPTLRPGAVLRLKYGIRGIPILLLF